MFCSSGWCLLITGAEFRHSAHRPTVHDTMRYHWLPWLLVIRAGCRRDFMTTDNLNDCSFNLFVFCWCFYVFYCYVSRVTQGVSSQTIPGRQPKASGSRSVRNRFEKVGFPGLMLSSARGRPEGVSWEPWQQGFPCAPGEIPSRSDGPVTAKRTFAYVNPHSGVFLNYTSSLVNPVSSRLPVRWQTS